MSRKEAILNAATELFAEKGYEGMTMSQIARKVGIRAPSLYAYFDSKENLFIEIYKKTLKDHFYLARSAARQTHYPSVKAQLEEMLDSIIGYQFEEAAQMKIYMRILLFPPDVSVIDLKERLLQLERDEYDLLYQIFRRGMETGEIREGDCHAVTCSMLCLMDGLFWQMQRYTNETLFRHRFQMVWRQFWESLAP